VYHSQLLKQDYCSFPELNVALKNFRSKKSLIWLKGFKKGFKYKLQSKSFGLGQGPGVQMAQCTPSGYANEELGTNQICSS